MNNKRRLWIIIVAGIITTIVVVLIAFRLTLVCCALPPLPSTLTARAVASAIVLTNDSSQPVQFIETQTTAYATGLARTPTFTPIAYNADMSPTAIPLPSYTPTPKPTLCPPSDVVCPGGNATLSPVQQVFVLMASAEGTEFHQLALTVTALAIKPTLTPTSSSPQCIWTWARKDLPEVTDAAQSALIEAGLKNVTVRSEAYGENCLDNRNGEIAHFSAMTTDFYLAATVKNLDDTNEMGKIIISAYNALTTLNIKLPAGPGYLDIVFSAGGQSKQFRTMFNQLKPLINAGKGGTELLAAGDFS